MNRQTKTEILGYGVALAVMIVGFVVEFSGHERIGAALLVIGLLGNIAINLRRNKRRSA